MTTPEQTLPKHCTCNKPYDPAYEMRRCGDCVRWFHVACLERASREPDAQLVVRGGRYGVVGNWGLTGNPDEPWRVEAFAPQAWQDAYDKAARARGYACGCGSSI
jgi:hypothetical protein